MTYYLILFMFGWCVLSVVVGICWSVWMRYVRDPDLLNEEARGEERKAEWG